MSLDNWDGTARAVLFGLADAAVRTMALAALAAATLAILRVKQPAARLRVWTFVLCAGLLLPLADWLLPDLTVPLPLFVLTPATTLANVQIASPFSIQSVEAAAPASMPMPLVLLFVYVLGVVALAVRAGRGWLAALRLEWNCGAVADRDVLERLAGHASNLGLDRSVRLLESDGVDVPVTTSVWRPALVLPANWREWPAATLDAVLVHELSHVLRHDPFIERLALAYRAANWPNPFAWWLRRRLSHLAEEASDAAALSMGVEPARYAQILLDFFVVVRRRPRRVVWSTAMARGKNAERRVMRVLEWKGSHPMSLSRPVAALLAVAALFLATIASIIRPVPVSASVPAPPSSVQLALVVPPSAQPVLTAAGIDVQGIPPAPPTPPAPPAPPALPSNDAGRRAAAAITTIVGAAGAPGSSRTPDASRDRADDGGTAAASSSTTATAIGFVGLGSG